MVLKVWIRHTQILPHKCNQSIFDKKKFHDPLVPKADEGHLEEPRD